MSTKVKKNQAEIELISALDALYPKKPYEFRKGLPELSQDQILNLCSYIWHEKAAAFRGKIIHTDQADKFKKISFLWACYYFSYISTGLDIVGCSWKMYHEAKRHVLARIKYGGKYSKELVELAILLNSKTKGRLLKLAQLDPLKIEGISEWTACDYLNQYQRAKIPVREKEWFYNAMKGDNSVIACSICDEGRFYCNLRYNEILHSLLQLQSQGYRFYVPNSNEAKAFRSAHPICDKCFNKNDCGMKRMRQFGGYMVGNFKCFVEPSEQPLKIDISLLQDIPAFRLQ